MRVPTGVKKHDQTDDQGADPQIHERIAVGGEQRAEKACEHDPNVVFDGVVGLRTSEHRRAATAWAFLARETMRTFFAVGHSKNAAI
jgi:hypothetical protein